MLRRNFLFVSIAALTLAACTSVDVKTTDTGTLADLKAGTYAWVDDQVPVETAGTGVDDVALVAEFREALDETLASRGYELVRFEDAALEATLHVAITKEVRRQDPYFTVYPWEQVEFAHLTVALAGAADGVVAWSASARRELRVTDRGTGHSEIHYTGTEEQRDWQAAAMATKALERLPRR